MNTIESFYNEYSEDERLTKRRSHEIEFISTTRYLTDYIKPEMEVIDIGAGTGTYSFFLSDKVSKIIAIEIVEKYASFIKQKAQDLNCQNIITHCVSATDLTLIPNNSSDMVLNLGPYYHLQKPDDRKKNLSEIQRVMKNNGTLFLSYINRAPAILFYAARGIYFNREQLLDFEKNDYSSISGIDPFIDIAFFSDPGTIHDELKECGFQIDRHIAADSILYFLSDQLEEMNDNEWNDFVEYHLRHCEDNHSIEMSMHGLIIASKK